MGAADRHIENRRTIGVYSEFPEILGEQSEHQFGSLRSAVRIGFVKPPKCPRGRQCSAEWRAQPLHPAAFLIDQHQHLVGADGFIGLGDEPADLIC